ncbi:MAG TPA: NUDIX hydrolase [Cryomorphaceae bacterium]|nr:NUDIX hydrolase [Owenweeksia sp.]MBG00235.1 NUDIX hydrolase [Owenweeksia sp.]HAD96845.1 NUDIX hydrolase [Cryomorphaceae bacterium]HBF19691.1 NUDIX hydrolase [Cryomorphaceae bacterium]HCQ14969.1 NUDIX hydrolase [Cryomorphaceae bacterium]|tara:strand:+ start:118 stop:720 length:603 start_codon:yes stop_codon:yes gene_type:complete
MYKVFINDSSLEFISNDAEREGITEWTGNESIEEWIGKLEEEKEIRHYVISCLAPDKVWKEFLNYYTIIEAAGGVVKNEAGEVLMIYRLDRWDLPKGKIEEGESIEEGAVREVEEECGITQLDIVKPLPITYHTYWLKGQRVLKRTYWFSMRTEHRAELVPQIEEHIAKAQWIKPDFLDEYLGNTYASIHWLLQQVDFND